MNDKENMLNIGNRIEKITGPAVRLYHQIIDLKKNMFSNLSAPHAAEEGRQKVDEKMETINGKSYSFYESGNIESPYTILDIHGLVGDGENFMAQLLDPKFEKFHQIAPNRFMDMGKLQKYEFKTNDPIEEIIQQYFVDLMNKWPDKKFILSGVSLGGEVAYRIAAKYPEQVIGVVLSGASGLKSENFMSGSLFPIVNDFDELKKVIQQHFVDETMMPANLTDKITNLFADKDLRLQLVKLAKTGKNPNVELNTQYLEKLKTIGMPITLFHGEHDTIMTEDVLNKFVEILDLPEANIKTFEAHHMPGMDGCYNEHNTELYVAIRKAINHYHKR